MENGVHASDRRNRHQSRAHVRRQSGRYRLDERVALCTTSSVWRATDLLLGRTVAVKRLRARAANHPTARGRFAQEVRISAAMQHPSVVRILDADSQAERPYLVTEWVEGESLAQVLRRGHLPPTTAVRIATALAGALAHVHEQRVVHCDVKPANVLIRNDGQVKLADFGIAAPIGASHQGTVFGSIHYMSPERLVGGAPSPACDVYALGVTLYEMITGRRPYTGNSPLEVARSHRESGAARSITAGRIPAAIARVLRTALAQEPADRFTTAAEFARRLATIDRSIGRPIERPAMVG